MKSGKRFREERMKNRREKIKKIKQAIPVAVALLMGVIIGCALASYTSRTASSGKSEGYLIFREIFLLVMIWISLFLQIVIHEAGHLVFGLLTGYQFSSFRIGRFMWIKRDGKIHFSRYSLAGTGGQCLLIPPDIKDGKYPYILYNLGGSLLNLISAVLFAIFAVVCRSQELAFLGFLMLAVAGMACALTNGIPLKLASVNNDGYNVISVGKDPYALRAFWIQMKVNQQIASGMRLRDMPEEWFEMPSDEEMKNSMSAALGVFACSRLMEQHDFARADQEMERLFSLDSGIVGVHKNLMQVDQIFCELVGGNREERLKELLDKRQKRFMKSMKRCPSVLRTEYAYALLAEKDEAKAGKFREEFEKIAKKYPYPVEIQTERELLESLKTCSKT